MQLHRVSRLPCHSHKTGENMKKMILIASAFTLAAGAIYGAAMRTHKDKKAKFSIEYPGGWKKKTNQDGVNLMLASKDDLANVQVIRSDVEAGTPTDTFLAEVEKAAGPGHVNQLPADKRSAEANDLAKMNADQGTAGVYQIENEGVKINQLIMAVRKGAVMYAIIVTFAEQGADQYKDVSTQIADSFKILN